MFVALVTYRFAHPEFSIEKVAKIPVRFVAVPDANLNPVNVIPDIMHPDR